MPRLFERMKNRNGRLKTAVSSRKIVIISEMLPTPELSKAGISCNFAHRKSPALYALAGDASLRKFQHIVSRLLPGHLHQHFTMSSPLPLIPGLICATKSPDPSRHIFAIVNGKKTALNLCARRR